jgi:hypothetical protein
MRRDASREGLKRFQDAQRGPPSQVPTLARLQRDVSGKWVWIWCAAYGCNASLAHGSRATDHPMGLRDVQ